MKLDLTPDELLSTTRAVRKRLDLTQPVEREVLEECLQLAQQAPTASYSQNWHFVVVTDAEKRAAIGEIWRKVAYPYLERGGGPREGQGSRIGDAVVHLAEHIHEVPVHVIPCVQGRYEGKPNALVASMFGSIIPAAWSFMLAARSRGLGTVLDDVPPDARAGGRGDPRYPVRRGDAGRADPGRVHARHRLQAREAQAARLHGPLGKLVARTR